MGADFAEELFMESDELYEEGWAGTFVVEPLTALAGGTLGGIATAATLWCIAWRMLEHRGK